MIVIRIWGFAITAFSVLLCGRRDCHESLLLLQPDLNFLPQRNPLGFEEKLLPVCLPDLLTKDDPLHKAAHSHTHTP